MRGKDILQRLVLLNKGLTGEFNSNITKLVLGKHGFHDKREVDLNDVTKHSTGEEADARIRGLLGEGKKGSTPAHTTH